MGNQVCPPAADVSWDCRLSLGTPRAQRPFLQLFTESCCSVAFGTLFDPLTSVC